MTVSELVQALANYAPGARVTIADGYDIVTVGSDGETVDLDIVEERETNP